YRARGRALLWIVALEMALGFGLSWVNRAASVFFIYAAAAAGQLDRPRHAWIAIGTATALALGTVWLVSAPLPFWIVVGVFTPLIGAVNLQHVQSERANAKLRLAHEEIEHLAAVAERERIARDLHDVLGHTLSLVTLKAQLAARLLERDQQRAAAELRELEQIARQALADVRETIRGYRATLDEEIRRARALLEAAGVRVEATVSLATIGRARDEVLALVLREMVTNTARHAGASVCRITVEETAGLCCLTVEDDGRGGQVIEGNGIRGMRERMEALGGTLTVDGSRGMRVTATLPLGIRAAAGSRPLSANPPSPAAPPSEPPPASGPQAPALPSTPSSMSLGATPGPGTTCR
ncbi:MAG TPA: sensor histidine kinase, partial [Gemmatimonadaceae bacterium]